MRYTFLLYIVAKASTYENDWVFMGSKYSVLNKETGEFEPELFLLLQFINHES